MHRLQIEAAVVTAFIKQKKKKILWGILPMCL